MKDQETLRRRLIQEVKLHTPGPIVAWLKEVRAWCHATLSWCLTLRGKVLGNRINLLRNRRRQTRLLEIGPGKTRIPDFETLNIVGGPQVDYVLDAAKPLPFSNDTFELVYASHVLEHIAWYSTETVLKEWMRILKPEGHLEVWVPNGLEACRVILAAEEGKIESAPDDWTVRNPRGDPFLWANGRLMYGARSDYPSWHRAILTPRHLKNVFRRVGFVDVHQMDPKKVRGYDHGWINLGVKGTKP